MRRVLRLLPAGLKDAVPSGLRRQVSRRLRSLNSRHAARAPLDPALRARLVTEMAPEIERIEATLGRRIDAWHPAEVGPNP